MSAAALESQVCDPIARWAAVLYCAGTVIWLLLAVLYLTTQQWLMAAVGLALTVVFAILARGWVHAARSRIRLDAATVSRTGPLGWSYSYAQIAGYDLLEIRGRTYLVVVPQRPPARTSMSRALLGKNLPRGAVTGPVQPDLAGDIRTVLAERTAQGG